MLLIEGTPNSRAVTIFVRGGNKMVRAAATGCCLQLAGSPSFACWLRLLAAHVVQRIQALGAALMCGERG
jgi:hypothetical protein